MVAWGMPELPGEIEQIAATGIFDEEESQRECLGDEGEAQNRGAEPRDTPQRHAGAERPGAFQPARQHARHDGRHGRPRRNRRHHEGTGENAQSSKVHGTLPSRPVIRKIR
jgi:hypothetical protein